MILETVQITTMPLPIHKPYERKNALTSTCEPCCNTQQPAAQTIDLKNKRETKQTMMHTAFNDTMSYLAYLFTLLDSYLKADVAVVLLLDVLSCPLLNSCFPQGDLNTYGLPTSSLK